MDVIKGNLKNNTTVPVCVSGRMNFHGPEPPRRERGGGPEAVSPSLIIAAAIMTAGTELI